MNTYILRPYVPWPPSCLRRGGIHGYLYPEKISILPDDRNPNHNPNPNPDPADPRPSSLIDRRPGLLEAASFLLGLCLIASTSANKVSRRWHDKTQQRTDRPISTSSSFFRSLVLVWGCCCNNPSAHAYSVTRRDPVSIRSA